MMRRQSSVAGRKIFHVALLLVVCLMFCATKDATAQRKNPTGGKRGLTPGRAYGALIVTTGQAGSVVFINNIRHGVTNEQGTVAIKRVWAGAFAARVRAVGFADWHGKVVIKPQATAVLKIAPTPTTDDALLHFQQGEALRDKAKHADAIKEFKAALTLRPTFTEARLALARSAISTQDFQESERQLELAEKNYGRPLAEAHTVYGNLRRQQGLLDEAIGEYRKALRIAAGNAFEAHIGLAIALNESGKTDEAVKEYRLGILQDMESEPVLYYQLGEILERAERNKEAIEAYSKYLQLDPEGEFAGAAESIIEQLKKP
ncbi:MAG: tetratricopeptide repeat protein [Acidobacteria bacterium]|nr:tetratricopeptide repeat protein [Acidobacteriota bacterium]